MDKYTIANIIHDFETPQAIKNDKGKWCKAEDVVRLIKDIEEEILFQIKTDEHGEISGCNVKQIFKDYSI